MGLVGGVGSGKSTLARRAAELYGFAVIDGDAAGHRALADASVKSRLRERFGDAVFTTDGSVNRSAVARLVFGPTPDHTSAKADLEKITHPEIRREFREQIAAARAAGAPAVLLDAAVLVEAGWRDLCDALIFVDAPREMRRSRVAERGWSEAEWQRREASQLSVEEKRRRADVIIENSDSSAVAAEALATAVDRLFGVRLPRPAAAATA